MTAKVDGQKTIEGLRRLSAGMALAQQRTMAAGVLAAESSAKATKTWSDRHPSDGTRSTIKGTVGMATGKVVARGAAIFLENGTAAHTITARNGGMLRFFVNGQAIFRRSVQHPGTKGTHFMRDARNHSMVAIEYAAEIYVNEAIARA